MSGGRRAYSFLYRIGLRPSEIDPIPSEILAWADGQSGPARALDLGCGTGRLAVALAGRGWDVVGVDFAAPAISAAARRADQAGVGADFRVGDVTRLGELDLGAAFQLVVDVKCLHGLAPSRRIAYAEGVAEVCDRAGTYLLFALTPSRLRHLLGAPRGITATDVKSLFGNAFTFVEEREGTGGPFTPGFYRMLRK
jgi:SAM-dependent methyltransferase